MTTAIAKRVLVTGGAGYIGSHTCKTLSRAGYVPVTYDRLVHGHAWAVKWGRWHSEGKTGIACPQPGTTSAAAPVGVLSRNAPGGV